MVDFENFLHWAESRFYDVQVSGDEIKINSIFKENDQDHKLWCNPSGGKKGVELGCYHCWKTDRRGTLAGLVMEVDGCSFREALEILGGETPFENLEKQVEEFWERESIKKENPTEEVDLRMPLGAYRILDLPPGNPFRFRAEKYLNSRKIPLEGLFVCVTGTYRNRIVIPYYNKYEKLIYFNCRALGEEIPKYLGPPKELGIGKSDVIYMPTWPKSGKIYITEGEFNAITLRQCGLPAAALGGKSLSETQLNILKEYNPVIALDNDSAGRNALLVIGETFLGNGLKTNYVIPPGEYNDWNALLQDFNPDIVRGCIEKTEKEFTETTVLELLEQYL